MVASVRERKEPMSANPQTGRRNSGKYWKKVVWYSWLPVLVLAAAWLISANSTAFYFPPAQTVFAKTADIWFFDGIISDMLPSLGRLVLGFTLAVVIGVLLGLLLGRFKTAEVAARPITEVVRAMPGVALLPIAMMFFGTGEAMKLVMIIFISMWPIVLNTIEGVRSIEPTLHSVRASFRLKPMDNFRFVFLPAAMPQVFAGARTSLAISVAVMVAVEMFGTPGGLGYFIRNAQQTFRIIDMWTGLLVLGIFGYLLNVGFRTLEGRVLRWHHNMVKHQQGGSS
ncbi:ABC transporter permease [Pseudarthrobacter sp. J75]|uniref:ABC transporter permease n=1 Tax=unclassified Pseudarthrobacter TaxID=2647000 RepID=UPI002E7FBA24|nr:ABC transporter permease [Pseudarthrobacter sp. J75]MEE2529228.1 ABC transporter permease [Pseudarthrobacter sp. J75]